MYKKLDIDFEIPQLLEDEINEMVDYLNNGGRFPDCNEEDIRNTLNGCDLCLEPEQIALLRQYYCRGGIYKSNDEPDI